MASVFDTAAHILKATGPIRPAKLQRLCYYAQAWSLAWTDTPLFEEEFHAWRTGPVCDELFEATRHKAIVDAGDLPATTGKLSRDQTDTIDVVVSHYAPHDLMWLDQLAHMETPSVGTEGDVLTKEGLADYYRSLVDQAETNQL